MKLQKKLKHQKRIHKKNNYILLNDFISSFLLKEGYSLIIISIKISIIR